MTEQERAALTHRIEVLHKQLDSIEKLQSNLNHTEDSAQEVETDEMQYVDSGAGYIYHESKLSLKERLQLLINLNQMINENISKNSCIEQEKNRQLMSKIYSSYEEIIGKVSGKH